MHGYSSAICWAVGILVVSAAIAVTFLDAGRPGAAAAGTGEADAATGAVEDETKVPVVTH
ncbi:hypothetical protein GCM10020367_27680 [Streptomyces sannanensis]|uniref:Class F sortase n=1 Tax=Streptomyces sannanensis TaxID=285536 RepID=A0ABP6SBD9_9ACTN